jgi:type IV pilus biogenesis protein CpaD/CtpE
VLKYLQTRHIPAAPAEMVATADNANVSIRIGRYVAKLPDCPDWQRLGTGGGYVDSGYKNFGCMNNVALGNMVIDPADLNGGQQPIAPGDGEWMASGVKRYREGKVLSTENVVGGVGGKDKAPE